MSCGVVTVGGGLGFGHCFTGTEALGGAGMPSALLGGVMTARALLGAR